MLISRAFLWSKC